MTDGDPCPWCECVGYHAETCEGFNINDPAQSHRECNECGAPMKSYGGVHNAGCPELWRGTSYMTSQGVGVERVETENDTSGANPTAHDRSLGPEEV